MAIFVALFFKKLYQLQGIGLLIFLIGFESFLVGFQKFFGTLRVLGQEGSKDFLKPSNFQKSSKPIKYPQNSQNQFIRIYYVNLPLINFSSRSRQITLANVFNFLVLLHELLMPIIPISHSGLYQIKIFRFRLAT